MIIFFITLFLLLGVFNSHAQTHPSFEIRKELESKRKTTKDIQSSASCPSSYGQAYASNQNYEYMSNFTFSVDENKGQIKIEIKVVITKGIETVYGSGEYVNVWIDWEGDGVFDDEDQIMEQMQYARAVGFKGILSYSTTVYYPEELFLTDETWIRASLEYGGSPPASGSWTYGSSMTKPISLGEAEFSDLKLYLSEPDAVSLKSGKSRNYPKIFGKGARIDPYYGINTRYSLTSTILLLNDYKPSFYEPNQKWDKENYQGPKSIDFSIKAKWPGTKVKGTVELWKDNWVTDDKKKDIMTKTWKKTRKSSKVLIKGKIDGEILKNLDPGTYELRFKRIPPLKENIYNMIPGFDILTPDKTLELDYRFSIDRLPFYIQSPESVKANEKIYIHTDLSRWFWDKAGGVVATVTGSGLGLLVAPAIPQGVGIISVAGAKVLMISAALSVVAYEAYQFIPTPAGWEPGDFARRYDWEIQKYVWDEEQNNYKEDVLLNWHRANMYRENLIGISYWSETSAGFFDIYTIDKSIPIDPIWESKMAPDGWPPKHFKSNPHHGYGKFMDIPKFEIPDPLCPNLPPQFEPVNPGSEDLLTATYNSENNTYTLTVNGKDPEGFEQMSYKWACAAGEFSPYIWNDSNWTVWEPPAQNGRYEIIVSVKDNFGITNTMSAYVNVDNNKKNNSQFIHNISTLKGLNDQQLLSNLTTTAIDSDNNSMYDTLEVSFSIDISKIDTTEQSTTYVLTADLAGESNEVITSSSLLFYGIAQAYDMTFQFPGIVISESGLDGPYKLKNIRLKRPETGGIREVGYDNSEYSIEGYKASDFEKIYLSINDSFSDKGVDEDLDGKYDLLNISIETEMNKTGTYILSGWLCEEDGTTIGSTFTSLKVDQPGIYEMDLNFSAEKIISANSDGQFLLRNLILLDSCNNRVRAYHNDLKLKSYSRADFDPPFASLKNNISEEKMDVNNDGLYDSLIIQVEINVEKSGDYLLSALLSSNEENIESTGIPVELKEGNNVSHILFSGAEIYERNIQGIAIIHEISLINKDNERLIFPQTYLTSSIDPSKFQRPNLSFGNSFIEKLIDENSDGKAEMLSIQCIIEALTTGEYEINSSIEDASNTIVSSFFKTSELTEGINEIDLNFIGEEISISNSEGPYSLSVDVWDSLGNIILYGEEIFITSAYSLSQFEAPAALITENYFENTADTDGNGMYDSLMIEVELSVSEKGNYTLKAECLDSTLQIIDEAEINQELDQGIHRVKLSFEGVDFFKNGVNGPFIVGNIFLYKIENDSWTNLDIIDYAYITEAYDASEFQHTDCYFANEYHDYGVDLNNNDLFDELIVDAGIVTEKTGSYRIDGQLYDNNGYYIETASIEKYLYEGHDTISLIFAGGRIRGHEDASPYHLKYTRIFNSSNELLHLIDETYTTQNYNSNQFEESEADLTLFATELVIKEGMSDDSIITLIVKIYNFGGTKVDSTSVSFYSWGLSLSEEKTAYNISGGTPGLVEMDIKLPSDEAFYSLEITVDPHDSIPELDEYNNNSILSFKTPITNFPAPPSEINALGSPDNINLSWGEVKGSISGFNLYRRIKGDTTYHKINSTLIEDLFFTDSTVLSDTVYYYMISSYLVSAPALEGVYSEEIRVETRLPVLDVFVGEFTSRDQNEFILPVYIGNLKGTSVNSIDMTINFDNDVLECIEASTYGTLTESWTNLNYECGSDGEIRIVMSGFESIPDTGVFIEIRFDIIGEHGDTSNLQIKKCMLNNGELNTRMHNGVLRIESTVNVPVRPINRISSRNYPNPFTYNTTIEYKNPELIIGNRIKLEIYTINMIKVMQWDKTLDTPGIYLESWDGCDFSGNPLPGGIYIFRLNAGENIEYGRMLMVK